MLQKSQKWIFLKDHALNTYSFTQLTSQFGMIVIKLFLSDGDVISGTVLTIYLLHCICLMHKHVREIIGNFPFSSS